MEADNKNGDGRRKDSKETVEQLKKVNSNDSNNNSNHINFNNNNNSFDGSRNIKNSKENDDDDSKTTFKNNKKTYSKEEEDTPPRGSFSTTKEPFPPIKQSILTPKTSSPGTEATTPVPQNTLASNKSQNRWRSKLRRKRFLASRNSVSSMDSLELVRMNASPSVRKKWTNFETAGRCLIIISMLLLILGVTLTVLGFIDLKLPASKQLPMQIIGPACLMTTIVMWVIGGMFKKILTDETENQKQLMRLRTRVQLHALAMDMYKKPQNFASQALEDPRIRKQLLLKLRQQNAMDNSSIDSVSRISSRLPSFDARSRNSHSGSIIGSYLGGTSFHSTGADRRRSTEASIGGGSIALPAQFDLPGIHISRIETLDFDDVSVLSGFGGLGPRRYIIIESDGSSEHSKKSVFNSECSFSVCSRSSKSRSSRDSSNFGSRWDFSKDSEWEVNPQNRSEFSNAHSNPRHASLSSATPSSFNPSFLSPSMPRKGSTVTFDTNEQNSTRRHSSPAPGLKKRDSISHLQPTIELSNENSRFKDSKSDWFYTNQPSIYGNSAYRKKSAGDQSLMSCVIDENDGDEEEFSDGEKEEAKTEFVKETSKFASSKRGRGSSWATSNQQTFGRRMSTVTSPPQPPAAAQKRRMSLWKVVQESGENFDDAQLLHTPFSTAPPSTEKETSPRRNEPLSRNTRSDSIFASFLKNKFVKQGMKFNLISESLDRHDFFGKDDAEGNAKNDEEHHNEDRKSEGGVEHKESSSRFSLFANSILSSLYGKSPEKEALPSPAGAIKDHGGDGGSVSGSRSGSGR